jgi:tetratricopeptide (TPR) repeat protein
MDDLRGGGIQRAQLLMQARRWADAAKMLSSVLASDPSDVRARCMLAQCYLNLGLPQRTLTEANTAIGYEPNAEWAHRLRALALMRMRHGKQAMAAAREAVRISPATVAPHILLSQVALQCKDMKLARAAALRAREIDPVGAATHLTLGNVEMKARNYSAAEASFREALRLDPQDPAAVNNLGNALKRQGKRSEALSLYANAARLDPRMQAPRTNALSLVVESAPEARLAASIVAVGAVMVRGAPILPVCLGLALGWAPVAWRALRDSMSSGGGRLSETVLERLRADARRPSRRSIGPLAVAFGSVLFASMSMEYALLDNRPGAPDTSWFHALAFLGMVLVVGGIVVHKRLIRSIS